MDGVIIKKLNQYVDERGWLSEIYRNDEDQINAMMGYVSLTKNGVVRGPHEHKFQTDFFIFIGPGDFELHLWDNRKSSSSFGKYMKIIVGESNKVSVIIPAGIVHGYKAISSSNNNYKKNKNNNFNNSEGSISINLPDKLYKGKGKKEEVDEIRHENDKNSRFKIE